MLLNFVESIEPEVLFCVCARVAFAGLLDHKDRTGATVCIQAMTRSDKSKMKKKR